MTEFTQHPVVQALAWALVHVVWQGAAIGLVTFWAFRAARTSASVRYAIGVCGLVAMLAAPVSTFLVLASETPAPAAGPGAAAGDLALAIPAGPGTVLELTPGAPAPRLRFDADWPAVGVIAWLAGVMFFSLRLAGGWIVARRYARRAVQPASDQVQALARRLADRLAVRRAVRVLQSGAVAVPVMIGWLKPTIVLPLSALSGLSPAQVEALLAHELAHVRRHDYLVNLLQSAAEALLFYHPAVWWLSRRVRAERELCCDDLAIGVCDRLVYATALTDLAAMASPAVALAATDGDLVGRVRRVLGQGDAVPAVRSGALSILALALVAGIGVPAALAQSEPTPAPPGRPTSLTFDHPAVLQTPPPTAKQTATEADELKRRHAELVKKLQHDQELRKKLQETRAEIEALRSQTRKLEVHAALEPQEAVEHVTQAAQVARAADIQAARKAYEDAKKRFDVGLISEAQLLEARAALARAEAAADARADLAADLEHARAQWERSLALLERGLTSPREVAELESAVARLERRVAESGLAHLELTQSAQAAAARRAADARELLELIAARRAITGQAIDQKAMAEALRAATAAHVDQAGAEQLRAQAERLHAEQLPRVAEQLQPLDPSAPVQAGDVLRVTITGEPDLPAAYRVAGDGTIRLPFVGSIKVAGLTAAGVREAVGKQLSARKLGSVDQVTVTAARPRPPAHLR